MKLPMQKQPSSSMCFVCGRDNPAGLHMHFFTDEQGRVHADYTPHENHQGYPGVMHGGLITTMLDEIMGRAAIANEVWCMTAKLEIRFRKPVPVDAPLKLVGEIKKSAGRLIEGHGEVRLADGTLAVEAAGTFVKIPDAQLAEFQRALGNWRVDD